MADLTVDEVLAVIKTWADATYEGDDYEPERDLRVLVDPTARPWAQIIAESRAGIFDD